MDSLRLMKMLCKVIARRALKEGFIGEFRMKKIDVHFLCDLLRNELQCKANRKCKISLEDRVLLSLNTLGSGSFQNSVKDKLNVSQSTVSKCLTEFT